MGTFGTLVFKLLRADHTVSSLDQVSRYRLSSQHTFLFYLQNIDGKTFVNLTKEQIVSLTGMKVGSSLKIFELIQVLKSKMVQQRQQQMVKVSG